MNQTLLRRWCLFAFFLAMPLCAMPACAGSPENPDALLERVKTLYRQGDEEAAAPLFSRLLDIHADNPSALLEIGRVAWDFGHGHEAAFALLAALAGRDKLSFDDVDAAGAILDEIYVNGDALELMRQRGELDAEERFLSVRHERHPDDAVALAQRGLARQKQYRIDDALADLIAAQKLGLRNLALRSAVQRARVDLERFEYVTSQGGHDIAQEFLFYDVREQMVGYERKGDWRGQERYLGDVMNRAPIRSFAAIQRGYLKIARGDLDGAEADFDTALLAGLEEESRADIERGRQLIAELRQARTGVAADQPASGLFAIASKPAFMGRMPSAPWYRASSKLQLAEQLVRNHAFQALGIVLRQLEDMTLSETEDARYQACVGEIKWAEGNFDEAVALFQHALDYPLRDTRRAGLLYRLARYFADKGERELGIEYARQSIALTAQFTWAQIRIGQYLIDTGEQDEGFAHLEKAVEMSATPEEQCGVYETIMEAYQGLGKRERFIETANRYIATVQRLTPPLPAALEGMAEYYQGKIHQAQGDEEQAYTYYERASRRIASPELRAKLLLELAETDIQRGDVDQAKLHAEEAAAIFPDRSSMRREALAFLQRLELEGGAAEADGEGPAPMSPRQALREYARLAASASWSGDADAYLKNTRLYLETADAADWELLRRERGLAEFYRAEIANARSDADQAYTAYERAESLLDDRKLLAVLFMRMARIDAESGRIGQAAANAGRSAELEPGNRREYLRYAARYLETIEDPNHNATEVEKGLAAFYTGEVHAAAGEDELAAAAYDRASVLVTDTRLLSAIFMKLAEYNLQNGEDDAAADLAARAADIASDQPERLLQAGKFLLGLDMPDRALPLYRRWLEATPIVDRQPAELFPLAEAFLARGETEKAFAVVHMVMQTEDIEASSEIPEGLLAYYKGRMYDVQGDSEQAFQAYADAYRLLRNPTRRSAIAMRMAEHQSRAGNRDVAAEYAREAAALLPTDSKAQRDAGYFFLGQGDLDEARAYFDSFVALAPSPDEQAPVFAALADAYGKRGDIDNYIQAVERYDAVIGKDGRVPTQVEEARLALFQADIHTRQGDEDRAFLAYQRATRFVGNRYQLADIYYRMAIYLADTGRIQQAMENMELSVASMPGTPWKLRQAGSFYSGIGVPDKMLEYYHRALDNSVTPESTAASLAALANAYKGLEDRERFLEYARRLVDFQSDRADALEAEERGMLHFYQAEIHTAEGDDDAAYMEYERAAQLVTSPGLRSDILHRMALYHAARGDMVQAADYMDQSVAALPDTLWKLRQAAGLYGSIGMSEKMLEYYRRALELSLTPASQSVSLAALANANRDLGDAENYLSYARRYVALQDKRVGELDGEEQGLRLYYQAEIHMAEGNGDAAYGEYERAAQLLTNPATRSGIFHQMALYHADRGDTDQAVHYMERSVALLPDTAWKLRQAAGLYSQLGLTEKAAETYRRVLALADKASDRIAARLALAELYRSAETREQYLEAVREYLAGLEGEASLTNEQTGQMHYYRGEVFLAEGRMAQAVAEYEQSLRSTLGDSRRVDLHLRIAQYYVEQNERKRVFAHMEEALAVTQPQIRTLRRIAELFHQLEMYDWEARYFQEALAIATTFREKAALYTAMANSARARKDEDGFLEYAFAYCSLMSDHWGEAANAEKGMSEYYRAEIHAARKERDLAYAAYVRATDLLESGSRLSEVYLKLARYDLARRDKALAATHALKAAEVDPGRGYRIAEAARILNRLRRFEDAARILHIAIAMDPVGQGSNLGNDYLSKYLAETYVEGIDKSEGLGINRAYIDRLAGRLNAGDKDNPDERVLNEWWDARRRQTRWVKNWGSFESRLYGTRNKNGNYTIGTYAELITNVRFRNGLNIRLAGEIGGVLKGHYTGKSQSARTGLWSDWESNSYLRDTLYGQIGARYTLFPNIARLTPLDFRLEYRFGLGRNDEEDFRARLKWDRSMGLSPRLSGNFWQYKKEEVDLTYSFTNSDWTTDGTIRRGVVYSPSWDRNLLIAPYAFMDYDYAGKDAEHKWGLAAGPGIVLRQYHWEDRYHAPRAYLEFNLRYRFGLSNGKQDALHFSLVYKF